MREECVMSQLPNTSGNEIRKKKSHLSDTQQVLELSSWKSKGTVRQMMVGDVCQLLTC